jgi:hypothetical protein
MLRTVILLFFAFHFLTLKAQVMILDELRKSNPNEGKINIISQVDYEQIIQKHIEINEKAKGIPGFRVQVFFSSGNDAKQQANKIKNDLRTNFPDYEVYLIYEEPFFKVRIGNFRTKADAYKLFKQVQLLYPEAFIVEDLISYENIH